MGALKNRSLIAGRMHLPKKTWLSDLGGDKTPINTVLTYMGLYVGILGRCGHVWCTFHCNVQINTEGLDGPNYPLALENSSHHPIFDVWAWLFLPKREAKNSGLHPKLSTVKMATGVDRELSVHNVCAFAGSIASHFPAVQKRHALVLCLIENA